MQEVTGSTPVFSTSFKSPARAIFAFSRMAYHVYIIYSAKLDRYYVGYSEDLDKRLEQHNSGISVFTSSVNDWKLRHEELFSSREEAMKREKEIKKKKSRKYIEWLVSSFG
jgi:putative endonuclease